MNDLTPREQQIANLIGEGQVVREISAHLGISLWTVKRHVKSIRAKLGVHAMRDIPGALARDRVT